MSWWFNLVPLAFTNEPDWLPYALFGWATLWTAVHPFQAFVLVFQVHFVLTILVAIWTTVCKYLVHICTDMCSDVQFHSDQRSRITMR